MKGVRKMENRFGIPKADYFTENSNLYTGSLLPLNYRMDAGGETIQMTVWYGNMCLAKSDPVVQQEFLKDSDGYDRALAWLEQQYQVCIKQQEQKKIGKKGGRNRL